LKTLAAESNKTSRVFRKQQYKDQLVQTSASEFATKTSCKIKSLELSTVYRHQMLLNHGKSKKTSILTEKSVLFIGTKCCSIMVKARKQVY
jgi:hypothetical protein